MVRENDLDRLQGSWAVATLEVDGQPMPAEMLAKARIVIKGDRFASTGMGADYEGTLQLDPSSKPRDLNMMFDAGPEKGNTNLGIYELDLDSWRLCLATRGAVRPSKFATTPGSGFALEKLIRGEAPAKKRSSTKVALPADSNAPATEFEGEWRMVSAVIDGKPMEESAVQWVKRVTRGNQTTVYAGPNVMLKVDFTHDASKTPKTIDYLNLAGSNKGKAQYGIYEFDGNILKVHVAPPGAARPAHFEASPGDRGSLTVWKRG